MNFLLTAYELLMNFLWPSYDLLMTFLWPSYELLMNFLWISYELLPKFLQSSWKVQICNFECKFFFTALVNIHYDRAKGATTLSTMEFSIMTFKKNNIKLLQSIISFSITINILLSASDDGVVRLNAVMMNVVAPIYEPTNFPETGGQTKGRIFLLIFCFTFFRFFLFQLFTMTPGACTIKLFTVVIIVIS
jgi:hypothetical protein